MDRKTTVLISDDYKDNRLLLKQICMIVGYISIETTNGQEAVNAVVENADIDIVLLDIEMPVMNGLEAAEEIRKLRPDIPIVAITAHNPAHFLDRLHSAGFDGYLAKPYTVDKLKNTITQYLERRW